MKSIVRLSHQTKSPAASVSAAARCIFFNTADVAVDVFLSFEKN